MKSSPDDPANTRSNGPNLVSGTLRAHRDSVAQTSSPAAAPTGLGRMVATQIRVPSRRSR
jgi:hypothetical protein